jgi:hypothetical protein
MAIRRKPLQNKPLDSGVPASSPALNPFPRRLSEQRGPLIRASKVLQLPPPARSFDLYESDVGWATSLEIVSDIPQDGAREARFLVPSNSSFLLVAVSTPGGVQSFAGSGVEIEIVFPKADEDTEERPAFLEPSNTADLFAHVEKESVVLGVMKEPPAGEWGAVVASKGDSPFSFHMTAFDEKALHEEALNARQMPIPFRCRACLATSKGVGAAVGVAAGLAAPAIMPAALVGALGSFLSVGVPIAGAFIGTVFKESSDGIAQKLCGALGFCERH